MRRAQPAPTLARGGQMQFAPTTHSSWPITDNSLPTTGKGNRMARVTGIGGIFFKADNPDVLYAWYERHLGIRREPDGSVLFQWQDDHYGAGQTVFAIFPSDTTYFDPSRGPFMLNFRVDDLDALLRQMEADGVE